MNIYQRSLLVVLSILGVILFRVLIMNQTIDANSEFLNTVSSSVFTMEEVELNIWGEYRSKYMSIDEMRNLATEIAIDLGIDSNYEENIEEVDLKRSFELIKKGAYSDTKIRIIEIIEEKEDNKYKARNYIIVTIQLNNKWNSIIHFQKILDNTFKRLQIDARDNLTLTAYVPGEIEKEDAKEMMTNIITNLNGEIQENYYTDKINSIYGYTKFIDEYIVANGEKINMDIAITYNEIEDRTYFYGALPVLTIEY